jgi:hypothetical protein
MSVVQTFEALSKAGIEFVVRDGRVIALLAESLSRRHRVALNKHRETLRAAVLLADEVIRAARAAERQTK